MTVETGARIEPESMSVPDRVARLRAIDTDVHNDLPSYNELKPYLAREWHPWLEQGGPGFAERAYANTGSGRMDDAVREEDGLAAGDPDWVIQQLRRAFHPIYEACMRHNLPLALHIGGEGTGISSPTTAVGHPTTYFEWYGSLPQSYMAHIMSMVTEGVFELFPTLKVVLYDGGVFWLPHVMWRFDKNWKAQRSETPWVKLPPSRYILDHFYLTSYPLEAAPR